MILLLLIGGTIAPESWRQKVFSKSRLLAHSKSIPQPEHLLAVPPVRDATPPNIVAGAATTQPDVAPAKPGKSNVLTETHGKWALPSVFDLSSAKGGSDVRVLQLKADIVRSPQYELTKGQLKTWVPRPWIQISITFSAKRNFDRLAMLYEIDDSWGHFADAIVYKNVQAGESLQAVAYLIPTRSQPMVTAGTEVHLDGFRVALIHRGSVISIAESGVPARRAMDREHGFLRPRSLTPFAPLTWDAFLPDAGFAEESDFQSAAGGAALTKTSSGR